MEHAKSERNLNHNQTKILGETKLYTIPLNSFRIILTVIVIGIQLYVFIL
jgi:hypothetical protein